MMDGNSSEQPLLESRASDRAAGRTFTSDSDYQLLRGDLVRAVAQTCPYWLAHRFEDLVQTALLRVMEIQRKREGEAELSFFYLKRTAYSTVVDEIRRLRRRPEVPIEDSLATEEPETGSPNPERQSLGRETGREIHDCLGRLIQPRRLAVMLHLQGHSVAELAPRLGWATKKAHNLLYRGLADMRECLGRKGLRP